MLNARSCFVNIGVWTRCKRFYAAGCRGCAFEHRSKTAWLTIRSSTARDRNSMENKYDGNKSCLNLPEGLILRKTFIDVPSYHEGTRRTKSCPARVCDVNNDLINELIVRTRSINKETDRLILETGMQIVCGQRMLASLPNRVFHVFHVIRRSENCLSTPFRIQAITDCLSRFFGISAILLERQIGWLRGGDSGDPLHQCLTVCCKCDSLLQKGIILIECRDQCGIFYVRRDKILKVSLPWLMHFSQNPNNGIEVPMLLTHGRSYPLLCMFSKKRLLSFPEERREAGYYTFTYAENFLDTPECTTVHVV